MTDDRRVMYHGFSYKGAHPTEWVWIAKNFLNLAFGGGHRVVKCSCRKEDSNIMLYLVDGEAWQTLDHFDPEFARDPIIVRLGLSMDGFKVYNTSEQISERRVYITCSCHSGF
jgi:hypothetical protein